MIRIGPLQVLLDTREVRLNGRPLRIGSRAFDVLELLIRADGALVSKDDIMRRVWAHTVVEENNLQVQIATLRKALGADRGRIVTVPGRGYRLVVVRDEIDAAALPAPVPSPTASGIPADPAALIGRQRMIADILATLERARVVTLVGAGGIGKTRAAEAAAAHAAAQFEGGIVFVPFASVANPRFALDALAGALGMAQPVGGLSLAAIVAHLAGRRILLVLDNCEHLIDAAAQIAGAITDACPEIGVLATSREALRIPGERLQPVPPLDVPAEDDASDAILRAGAVQLFVARARAGDPRFPVDAASLRVIGGVCRRLDGLPLAIELAAARAAVLGIEVLAGHLDDHFRVLAGGFRTALPRHQTLKAMLDWSYRLLDEPERVLLRSLGVFLEGFSLDAVCHVVGARGFSRAQALDALGGLVSKSLVIRDSADGATRYRLLAVTRAYALQQLEDNGERKAASLAHARYFRVLLTEAPHGIDASRPGAWLAAFRHELGNLRTALDWAFSPRGDQAVGVELATVAVPCLFDLSLVDECCERSRIALDATLDPEIAPVSAGTRMRLLAAYAASLAYTAGPTRAVHDAWANVHALALAERDTEYELRALWGHWTACQLAGDVRTALQWAGRLSERARALAQPASQVLALRSEAVALHYAGEQDAAGERLERMLRAYDHGAHRWEALGMHIEQGIVAQATLARVRWCQGAADDALRLARHAFERASGYAHDLVTGYVLAEGLVPVALLCGAADVAAQGIDALRTCATRAGIATWLACCDCYDEYLRADTDAGTARLPQFRAALDTLRATGCHAPLTLLLARYARCLHDGGRPVEAAETLALAQRHADAAGERWFVAELARLRVDLAQPAPCAPAAREALDAWWIA
ncbi:ATP-binding protein [Burkholderia sp. F1]|uniref:ATP-binding protein n=1 Tax=Burkholderia sp. F1 TaxID=3366817 RepID=UPI003D756347